MKNLFAAIFACFISLSLQAQTLTIDGYAYESGNRGYLNATQIVIFDVDKETVLCETLSDLDGHFECEVPAGKKYILTAYKEMFEDKEIEVKNNKNLKSGKLFVKLEMQRAPGYIFEITLAEARDHDSIVVDAIKGADIEVYNNTTKKMELDLQEHAAPNFRANLIKGNHYTVLIRKEGFFTKRMEAFVDIEGCILCFDGIGDVRPGVTDNLTEGNANGVLLANVEMEPVYLGREMQFRNILYEYTKADLTPDARAALDNLIVLIRDNPNLTIELGSHTDSRGREDANMSLSIKRAKSAVDYILENSDIPPSSIISRGYGETDLLNKCTSFVECTEAEHARNRRTEIKILGINPNIKVPSLAQEKRKEREAELIEELLNQEQVRIPDVDEVVEEKAGLEEEMEEKEEDARFVGTVGRNALKDRLQQNKEAATEKEIELDEEMEEEPEMEEETMMEEEPKTSVSKKMNDKKDAVLNYESRIVIHQSKRSISDNNLLKDKHEDLQLYKMKNGDYLYTIGSFEEEKDAVKYLMGTVKKEYPKAYIVNFVKGKLETEL